MRILSLLAASMAVVTVGCADIRDLGSLSGQLAQEFHAPASLNLSNGSHLRITFQNLPPGMYASADSGRQQFARDVARFAKAHYAKASQLQDITIAFTQVTNAGPVSVTRSDAPYSFPVRDLP
jgi:hypothetical protein